MSGSGPESKEKEEQDDLWDLEVLERYYQPARQYLVFGKKKDVEAYAELTLTDYITYLVDGPKHNFINLSGETGARFSRQIEAEKQAKRARETAQKKKELEQLKSRQAELERELHEEEQ